MNSKGLAQSLKKKSYDFFTEANVRQTVSLDYPDTVSPVSLHDVSKCETHIHQYGVLFS